MKKRHRSPNLAILLTTALLGLGALPAAAQLDNTLDSYANDLLLQNSPTFNHFALTVSSYPDTPNPPFPEIGAGYFVGLTQGVLTDLTTGHFSDPFYMFCIDFNHDIHPQVQYNTVIESINGLPGGPNDPPDPGLGENLYTLQLQALLGANFGTTPSGNTPFDADAQYDIWNLDTPVPNPALPGPDATMLALLASAIASQPTANFSGAYLFDITPYDAQGNPMGPGQAFMPVDTIPFHNSSTPDTPEPATLVMLGVGLIGLGTLKLRRRQR